LFDAVEPAVREFTVWGLFEAVIYTGHSDLAWKLLDSAWTPGHASKQEFLARFCGQLATSQYFSELQPALTGAPYRFDPKLGERM
jgi:hypothetical protein